FVTITVLVSPGFNNSIKVKNWRTKTTSLLSFVVFVFSQRLQSFGKQEVDAQKTYTEQHKNNSLGYKPPVGVKKTGDDQSRNEQHAYIYLSHSMFGNTIFYKKNTKRKQKYICQNNG